MLDALYDEDFSRKTFLGKRIKSGVAEGLHAVD